MSKLLQVSLNENLIEKLNRVAKLKGVDTNVYIKLVLMENIRKEDDNFLTENGFSDKEEKRLLVSWNNIQEEIKNKKVQSVGISDFLDQI